MVRWYIFVIHAKYTQIYSTRKKLMLCLGVGFWALGPHGGAELERTPRLLVSKQGMLGGVQVTLGKKGGEGWRRIFDEVEMSKVAQQSEWCTKR